MPLVHVSMARQPQLALTKPQHVSPGTAPLLPCLAAVTAMQDRPYISCKASLPLLLPPPRADVTSGCCSSMPAGQLGSALLHNPIQRATVSVSWGEGAALSRLETMLSAFGVLERSRLLPAPVGHQGLGAGFEVSGARCRVEAEAGLGQRNRACFMSAMPFLQLGCSPVPFLRSQGFPCRSPPQGHTCYM